MKRIHILVKDTWITVGFTYYLVWQKYALVKLQCTWDMSKLGLCLACAIELYPSIDHCIGLLAGAQIVRQIYHGLMGKYNTSN